MINECTSYEELLNKDDFLHKVKIGKEQIYNIKMNDINFLSFLCDNAFSSEASTLSRRCINAINVYQGVIAKFLLKDSSLFEAYFSSFSQSTTYRMWALTTVLSHFLSSFPDDVNQLLNNSDVILPTLLHHLHELFVQDFFYQLNDLDPKLTTKLFSAILRILCSKEVSDEHLASIIKKSFIDERKS